MTNNLTVKDFAYLLIKYNVNINMSYEAGGWYITMTDSVSNQEVFDVSGDIMSAIENCFVKLESIKSESKDQPTLPVTKRTKK